ncbi:MAG TPA: DUF3795 domain-containing protein [Bacteroidales bacterium]|nr:DUF3795 domain-containing protein [Bacteroidales bacterium]
MLSPDSFDSILLAPCGIYCGACSGYLRPKNKCTGCRIDSETKPTYCKSCKIANCELLAKTESRYCYDCEKLPCQRLKQLDKRYRTKYNTGLIQNLMIIKEKGMDTFMKLEREKRTCVNCGSIISIHRENCTACSP